MQGVSKDIKKVLAQVCIQVALKPHCMLSKLKDRILVSEKSGLVYEIPCCDCNAIYIGESRCSLKTRKGEHFVNSQKNGCKKSALCQRIVDFDHFMAWDEARI